MAQPASAPPFPGLAPVDSLYWSIPGLKEDPTMCLRCRAAQMLCGKPVCPILIKYDAFAKTLPMIDGRELDGSSPPALFIGRFGWPNVRIGPLLSPVHGDTLLYDTPEAWVGRPVQELVGFRTGLVRGTHPVRVTDAEQPLRMVEDVQLLARATESVEAEARFVRPPRGHLTLSDEIPPYGPSAPIEQVRLDIRRVDEKVDRLVADTDATARIAVEELYHRGVRVSRIQRAFSAGTLGRRGRRRFVPTRWSITAVDDLVSKVNLDRVRQLPELGDTRVYRYTALDNRWVIVLLPGRYRYESIEAWYPNTLWNPSPGGIVMVGDHEWYRGRTKYASIGGCYYAARLATSESLLRENRQAGVVVLREVHPGEVLPMGVWNVREHVREAMRQRPDRPASWEELFGLLEGTFAIPLSRWLATSALLHDARTQRRLEDYETENPECSSAAVVPAAESRPAAAASVDGP